jgi:phenylpyruvate tautomerase PptA (4-oxalocrotonate tautomerase family)
MYIKVSEAMKKDVIKIITKTVKRVLKKPKSDAELKKFIQEEVSTQL